MTPVITLKHLRGACRSQRAIFKKEWPNGAALTIKNARRAAELGLDVSWLLDYVAYVKYSTLLSRCADIPLAFIRAYRTQLKREAKS